MSGWSEADLDTIDDTIDAADEIEVVPDRTPGRLCRSGWSGLATT